MNVGAGHDIYNDGRYHDRGENEWSCGGARREIARIGYVTETGEPMYLFDGAYGRLHGGRNCSCSSATIA
ncbi:hypothetical protein GCT13_47285 [Paraburkholderia sp. CNPSo 3157]|uniref:Uncharacterized protein n=1 Tax=Paraburkholderia franconis TaxID=2654983 RepID=A0A7X1TLX2_9BURK|nr:hypothetical protein [Paraburkholderia franconis]